MEIKRKVEDTPTTQTNFVTLKDEIQICMYTYKNGVD
jgi:hypothetical protein